MFSFVNVVCTRYPAGTSTSACLKWWQGAQLGDCCCKSWHQFLSTLVISYCDAREIIPKKQIHSFHCSIENLCWIPVACWINARPVSRALMVLDILASTAFPAIPSMWHMLQPHFTSPHCPNTSNISSFWMFAFGHAWIALCLIHFLPKEFLLLQDSAQISPFQLHKERQSPVSLFS